MKLFHAPKAIPCHKRSSLRPSMSKVRPNNLPIDFSKYPVHKGCRVGPAEDDQRSNQKQNDNQGHHPPSPIAIQERQEFSKESAGHYHGNQLLTMPQDIQNSLPYTLGDKRLPPVRKMLVIVKVIRRLRHRLGQVNAVCWRIAANLQEALIVGVDATFQRIRFEVKGARTITHITIT